MEQIDLPIYQLRGVRLNNSDMVLTNVDAHVAFQYIRHQYSKNRCSLSDGNIPLFVDIKKPIFSIQNTGVKLGQERVVVVKSLGEAYHVVVQSFYEVFRLHIWFLLMRL
jgi:hypothetical protein